MIAFCEIEVGHRLRTGQSTHLSAADAFAHRYELFTDWLVGTLLVGCALAAAAGLVSYVFARAWARWQESGPLERRARRRRQLAQARWTSSTVFGIPDVSTSGSDAVTSTSSSMRTPMPRHAAGTVASSGAM